MSRQGYTIESVPSLYMEKDVLLHRRQWRLTRRLLKGSWPFRYVEVQVLGEFDEQWKAIEAMDKDVVKFNPEPMLMHYDTTGRSTDECMW